MTKFRPTAILCALLALPGCAVTQSQTAAKQTCPPVKTYTAAQESQVADELGILPAGTETAQWITDYIAERDELEACVK